MRLFTAILFDDKVKNELYFIRNRLKDMSVKGTFTNFENFHLTLVFLGEVEGRKTDAIKKAIDKVQFESFAFSFDRIGKFRRTDGDIYWVGIAQNEKLLKLQKELSDNLALLGFEKSDFNLHITLGRRVVLKESVNVYDKIRLQSNLQTTVKRISLMKSENINGVLTYTEI